MSRHDGSLDALVGQAVSDGRLSPGAGEAWMATRGDTMDQDTFRSEAQRRLIDTWSLMMLLGLRSRRSVWDRVEAGKLPAPIYVRDRVVALWDRDEVTAQLEEVKVG